jgi:lipoprotein NlpD
MVFGSLAMGSSRTNTRSTASTTPSTHRAAPASVRHRVAKGENLYRIALSYGVTVPDLCRANGIKDPAQVEVGQVVFIPVTRGAAPPTASAKPRSPAVASQKASLAGAGHPPALPAASRASLPAEDDHELAEAEETPTGEGAPKGISFRLIPTDEGFSWPIQGGIVHASFGMRHGRQHAGIDISAPSGSPVYAARDGEVAYSGHKFRGYGNVVMIDHGDGFTTVYAHNLANLVREGESVVRGQIIARVGATGNATGAHCHFEIRNENLSVDPRGYLSESPESDLIFASSLPPRSALRPKPAALTQPDLIP